MRLVSLDIDPHHRSHRIHLGPFVAGLNAIYGSRGSGKSTIAKFIRGLLYHRHRDASGYGQEAVDGLVGSMQWADACGATRIISSADAVNDRDYRFDGPHFYGRQQSTRSDAAYPHSIPSEQPWQRLGGEIFDAVFCGRLGEVLPERLWQAARELGIHVATGNENDETYQRLKAEERRLQQRLHHLRVDDRDREWWSAERDRLASRLDEVRFHRGQTTASFRSSAAIEGNVVSASTSQRKEWESQRMSLHAERAELQTRAAELRQRLSFDNSIPAGAYAAEAAVPPTNGRYSRTTTLYRDAFGTWSGYLKPSRETKETAWKESPRHGHEETAKLQSDLSATQHRLSQVNLLIEELDAKLRGPKTRMEPDTAGWEADELQSRLAYADEVLKSWDLYEQTRQRLDRVQQQLRGLGPYHEAFRGSFTQCVERYIRELSAGSLRQLPAWAVEALRRDLGYAAGLSTDRGRVESYREVYRDYRPDMNRTDYPVPPSQSSERQLTELAIRMAILDSAAHRIGRLPLILDDALDGFHGQTLDHVVRVLIEFARDGQQILLMTSEPEVAERVRVHHGWVSHLQQGAAESANANFPNSRHVDSFSSDLNSGYLYGYDLDNPRLVEANAQLAHVDGYDDLAASSSMLGFENRSRLSTAVDPRFSLTTSDSIQKAPGLRSELGRRIQSVGLATVGQFVAVDPERLARRIGYTPTLVEVIRRRQAESRLLCGVPDLRAFDAKVLAACGFESAQAVASMKPTRLLRTVERFLGTAEGQELMQTATSYELSRIMNWIASARPRRYQGEGPSHEPARRRRRKERRERCEASAPTMRVHADRTSEGRRRRSSGDDRSNASAVKRTTSTYRFYLDPSSPVVDAPSIGSSLAAKLQAIGIFTVDDLLKASPQRVANELAEKRISVDVIADWQHQASLVCRIPNLRGHDAQMLVAAGVTAPEQLLVADIETLQAKIAAFASSKAGLRLLRGAPAADRREIQEWISWAQRSRHLRAA